MLDLKLFKQLQGDATATLILKPYQPGTLQYFLIASTVNYNVVVAGECSGELPSEAPLSFNVVLSSIAPLLDKNYKFTLTYHANTLRFVEENDKFSVVPLFVEHVADYALNVIQRYLEVNSVMEKYFEVEDELEELEEELRQLKGNLHVMESQEYGYSESEIEKRKREIDAVTSRINELQNSTSKLKRVDMEKFRRLAMIAARNNTTLAMCETYAVVSLPTAYVIQKADCGVRSIQGKLLLRLLMEANGAFFEYDGDLVFRASGGKKRSNSSTFVFINSYLPSTTVDPSLIKKGAVKEKYTLNIKDMLKVISAVSSKFTTMTFNLGASTLVLGNDRGEVLTYKFTVEDAQTIELNKMLRGETVSGITMSSVEVPPVVQRILPFMKEDFTIYVKSSKIVLQSGDIYIVFSK